MFIKFHFTYYIVVLSYILTGKFINIIIITSLIIIHELGHYLAARITNINVSSITLYPYGGLTKIDDLIDIDLLKELLISISGITFQSIYFLIIYVLYKNNILRVYTYNLYYKYHYSMILFNIIPIYPLDGSKILNIFINKLFNYNLSNKILVIISILNIIIILYIFNINYSYLLVLGILINYIINYIKNIKYLFNRFLLEKYLYGNNYKKIKLISSYKKMSRNRIHIINNNNKYFSEKELLNKYYCKDK